MTIIRQEAKDYGGIAVWDDRDPDTAVYFSPEREAECFDAGVLNEQGQIVLDGTILARIENRNNPPEP